MRKLARLMAATALCASVACTTNPPPETALSAPRYPDFVRPSVPDGLSGLPLVASYDAGWRALEAGNLRGAERTLTAVRRDAPSFYPADAALAYVALARRNSSAALASFDRVLTAQPDYISALVGRGHALSALGREADALASYERAVVLDPSLADLGRRVAVGRFRLVERDLAAAREAVKAGKLEDGRRLYERGIADSPESAVFYRELGRLEQQLGHQVQALAHLRQAATLEPTDASTFQLMGDILESQGDLEAAIQAFDAALALDRLDRSDRPDRLDRNDALEAHINALRARRATSGLAPEYQAIAAASQVTRGDLAAMIAVRLAMLIGGSPSIEPALMTDTRGHWAERWIAQVVQAGIMSPYENHTFQPREAVRRVDLADVTNRLLNRIADRSAPGSRPSWLRGQPAAISDVARSHAAYRAVSTSVAAGVLTLSTDGAFQPLRRVSGAELVEAIRRLEALARSVPAGPRRG